MTSVFRYNRYSSVKFLTNRMRIIFTAFALFVVLAHSYAQIREPEEPQLWLRTSLVSPFEADGNVMLGLGVQWKSRWAGIVDGGYIFSNLFENNSSDQNELDGVTGLKLRTEFRYYLKDVTSGGRTVWYIAPVFHYKKVSSERSAEFGINCANGNCAYFQIDTYKRIKQEVGGLLTLGTFSTLFGGDRFAVETFIGLGIKGKKFRNTAFPRGATLFVQPGEGWFSTERDGSFPMIPVGIKLSFRLL